MEDEFYEENLTHKYRSSALENINIYVDLYLEDESRFIKCKNLAQPYIDTINKMAITLQSKHNKIYDLQDFRDFIAKRIKYKQEQKEKAKSKKHKNKTWLW